MIVNYGTIMTVIITVIANLWVVEECVVVVDRASGSSSLPLSLESSLVPRLLQAEQTSVDLYREGGREREGEGERDRARGEGEREREREREGGRERGERSEGGGRKREEEKGRERTERERGEERKEGIYSWRLIHERKSIRSEYLYPLVTIKAVRQKRHVSVAKSDMSVASL